MTHFKSLRNLLLTTCLAVGAGTFAPVPVAPAKSAPPTPLAISQVPLTVASPTHPQVLFAIGNSESMDGDLSGAIMTGSGSVTGSIKSLQNSSSPVNYDVPAGFTPPVTGSTGPTAPYTVKSGNTLTDNSASRLNVAKAGMQAIIAAYAQNTDFALEDYDAGTGSVYTTWVYLMSGPGGFTFSNDNTAPPAGFEYVANPCYDYDGNGSGQVDQACKAIATLYSSSLLASNQYMLVSQSSDDASVNDVLYSTSGLQPLFDTYDGPHPASPFPPNFSLTDYNKGGSSILIKYNNSQPNVGSFGTTPTNAGYVPYSPQVIYAERGFGYNSTASATSGNILVPMKTAGANPTPASVAALEAAFNAPLAPETNDTGSNEIKAVAVQSPVAGLMQKAKSYLTSLPNPGKCNKQYVILISDGLPTQDLSNKLWPPLGSTSAQQYGETASFNADGSLDNTNDQALTDTIAAITALQQAGVNVYVVGMGAGVDPTLNPQAAATLKAMAVAGGTSNYFPATSPADLVTDLNSILISIQNGSLASTSVAVNSGSLDSSSTVYQATFTVSDSPYQDWTGDINAYPIAADGSISSTSQWSAKAQLTAQAQGTGWDSGRFIATWNPATTQGVPFRWINLSATQQADLQQPGDPAVTPPTLSYAQLRLNYLHGDTSNEQHNKGPFRNRSGLLGDIVDSNPLYVSQPLGPYLDASYQTFEQKYQATPRPAMLYAGSNDGMLHAIDAATGNEQFAFVPNAVFANLANLASPFYNSNHHFFVDGATQASDVLFGSDGNWHTILVGGENAGGNSIYALDVTNPQSLTTETAVAKAVLWEFTDSDMGLSFSAPVIARINANQVTDSSNNAKVAGFAVMFGNGYNSPNQTPVFYAVKPDSGAIIAKINLCTAPGVPNGACNPSLPNGLSSVAAGNSSGILGFPVDEVYAGDLQGNLWAIDVGNSDPSKWTVRLIFQARDSSGNLQPITTVPALTLNPNYPSKLGVMVVFGTGQLLQNADLTNTNTQSFYAVWDKGATTPATRADLQQQTFTTDSVTTVNGGTQAVRTSSNNSVDWATQQGWYYDLPLSGERVITPSQIRNGGVIFNSYTPNGTSNVTCGTGGVSWLMEVAYNTGGPFSKPQLDVNGSGNLNAPGQQTASGANPTGMLVSNSFSSAAAIMHAGLPNGGDDMKIVNVIVNGQPVLKRILERSPGPTRTGWWQIQ